MEDKILIQHILNCKEELKQLYKSASILEHKVTLGTSREGFINNFLKNNLPKYINYNNGEVFDSLGKRSGQMDIVLHPISSPKLNVHQAINLFPVETVLAVIEVKSSLISFSKILESCKKVKLLENVNRKDILDSLPYIIFAYKGSTKNTIIKNMEEYIKKEDTTHLGHLPNMIYVLDKDYCLIKCKNYMENEKNVKDCYKKVFSDKEPLLGLFSYLLKLTEEWSAEPQKHTMPIEKYIENEVGIDMDDW